MKKSYLVIAAALLVSCTNIEYFGEKITENGAIAAGQLSAKMQGQDSMNIKVRATIIETCAKKGCWMDVYLAEDETLKVRFKDYGFFVPTEGVEGKTACFEGVAYYDTLSVEILQHYAEDAGKTTEEIELITEPEIALAFEAKGVIIKDAE